MLYSGGSGKSVLLAFRCMSISMRRILYLISARSAAICTRILLFPTPPLAVHLLIFLVLRWFWLVSSACVIVLSFCIYRFMVICYLWVPCFLCLLKYW